MWLSVGNRHDKSWELTIYQHIQRWNHFSAKSGPWICNNDLEICLTESWDVRVWEWGVKNKHFLETPLNEQNYFESWNILFLNYRAESQSWCLQSRYKAVKDKVWNISHQQCKYKSYRFSKGKRSQSTENWK